MKNKILIPLLIALFAFLVVPAAALSSPTTYYFSVIQTVNPTVQNALESQLYVEVSDVSGTAVKFSFHNYNKLGGTTNMVVTEVYFDNVEPPVPNPYILDYANPTIVDNPVNTGNNDPNGTDYEVGTGSNPGLPSGNNISFVVTEDFDPENPAPQKGLNEEAADHETNPIEVLDISFDYLTGINIDNVNAALTSGALDIGMHVQAIGVYGGNSLSVHLNGNGNGGPGPGPVPIPEPATMLLLGTGLIGIAGTARRRKKLQK